MFCQKCGNEVREGAVFCQKCGTKLIKEEVAHRTPVDHIPASPKPIEPPVQPPPVTPIATPAQQTAPSPQSPAPSASTGTSEIYKLLKDGVSHCPKVKAVTPSSKGNATVIKGAVYNFIVNTVNGQIKLGRAMTKPFTIPLAIIGGFMAWVAASIGWDMMDGYGFNEDYTIPLAIGLLAIGLFGIAVTFFGEKESKAVLPDIRKALGPRPITMPTDEQQKKSYIIMLVAYNAVALIGVVVLIFNLVPSGYFGGRRAVDSTAYNYNVPTPSSSASLPGAYSESVSLSGTYTNTEEGFAFKYPVGWTVREDYSLENYSMIAVLSSGDVDSGYRANIGIIKSDIDDTFSATISEIHEAYSLTIENQKNLKIISLSDITLNGYPARKIVFSYDDNRGSYTNIQFFYAVNYTMYLVHCTSLQSYFDKYEPIFNAIMDTYTITQQNQNTFQATHIVVTNDGTNLRLREAPGFSTTQIGSLVYGSSVRVLEIGVSAVDDAGNRGNWTYVTTENGRAGWCFGAYLQPLP